MTALGSRLNLWPRRLNEHMLQKFESNAPALTRLLLAFAEPGGISRDTKSGVVLVRGRTRTYRWVVVTAPQNEVDRCWRIRCALQQVCELANELLMCFQRTPGRAL